MRSAFFWPEQRDRFTEVSDVVVARIEEIRINSRLYQSQNQFSLEQAEI